MTRLASSDQDEQTPKQIIGTRRVDRFYNQEKPIMANQGATEIDLRDDQPREWDRPTGQTHLFQVIRYDGYILEAEDLHFHFESAVFLPDYEVDKSGQTGSNPERITGLAVLRAAYLHAHENPSHQLLIVGHTDTSGPDSYNTPLSYRRAENVLYTLLGDREAWVETALRQSRVEDYQQIIKWVARSWGWPCDPGDVDNLPGPMTHLAVESFQYMYNEAFNASIAVDGKVGRETWGAIFDLYMRELSYMLETDAQGLESYRQGIHFVNDGAKALGGGEKFPIDRRRINAFRSAQNRRVELLFFEPADKPRVQSGANRNKIDPELSIVYNPHIYQWTWIPVDPVPILVWIDLQTVDELGRYVPNVKLILKPEIGEALTIETDAAGYYARRVRAGGRIEIYLHDETKLHFGIEEEEAAEQAGTKPAAKIEPRIAARVISDIVIPGAVGKEVVKEHEETLERYGRLPKGERRTRRSKGPTAHTGEEAKAISSRGGVTEEVTVRTVGNVVADNLWIPALFDDKWEKPWSHLHTWLRDYHPTVIARGYFLQIVIGGKQVALFEIPSHSASIEQALSLGTYDFEVPNEIGGRTGVYAPFEFFDRQNDQRFVDMNTNLQGVGLVNDPDRTFVIWELLPPDKQDEYKEHVRKRLSRRMIELVYLFKGDLLWAGRKGGTGLLEPYSERSELRKSAHQRNLAVAKGIQAAYNYYLHGYIEKVKAIPSDPKQVKQGDPHPEIQLHRLGPPDSAFAYPKPAGATSDEYNEIIQAGKASALDAWREISKKLDEIWGRRSEGSVWIVVEFTAEAGEFAGPFSGSNIKLNFEVDEEFRVKTGSQRTLSISAKGGPEEINGKLSVEKDIETGREKTKVNFNLGKYGVEADSDGNVKFSAGLAETEFNQATAIGGFGLEVSLRDQVAEHFTKSGEKPPEWVQKLPDLKAKVGIGFRLSTPGTILKLVSNAPGFFEMRPRREFVSLDWASLDWDEQQHLETLGWQEEDWNRRRLPTSAKTMFSELEPNQKISATRLPIPTSDPEWLNFWHAFGK